MIDTLINWLTDQGIAPSLSSFIARTAGCLTTVLLCFISYIFTKHKVLKVITYVIKKTKTQFDDIMLKNQFFKHIPKLVPSIILIYLIPVVFESYVELITILNRIVYSYITLLIVLTLNSFLTVVTEIYKSIETTMKLPITSLVQVVRIILAFIGILIILGILLNKSPLILLSGLGALTAVFMLVFKDSLMGFVAGIQLTLNHMVDRGNWISMPKYGADGNVIDITLTTVKVCNWDNTITMVPTYALMSESFKNWKGMSEAGGRRIKRSIFIDMQSIRFCDDEMLSRLEKVQLISDFIKNRKKEIFEYNQKNKVDLSNPVNGRKLTNIGLFRVYIESYLRQNPNIKKDMTFLVRQLQPTTNGLPIEIYVFCSEIQWVKYESVQADIFDHIFAIIQQFDLEMFQTPTGADFNRKLSDM